MRTILWRPIRNSYWTTMTNFNVFIVHLCLALLTLSSHAFIIPQLTPSASADGKSNNFNNFRPPGATIAGCLNQPRKLQASSGDDDQGNINDEDSTPEDGGKKQSRSIMDQAKERIESIHVEKLRNDLEVANTKSFLKRRPIKLPYNDARKWVQANLGCDTKEEFDDFVLNGILRTPYIPKNPETYYTNTREWISWDHFLTGCFDNNRPSAIQPQTGVFD